MDKHRKNAYRFLLYWAMLDIRRVQWVTYRWYRLFNPRFWRCELRQVRYAGALANWLHNLAFYASVDFDGFNEDWFWRDFQTLQKSYPQSESYRTRFEERLRELQDGKPQSPTG